LSKAFALASGFLILVLIASLGVEVFARYLFNNPTKWSYDVSIMSGGAAIILAAAYVYFRGEHVRVDVLYTRMSATQRKVVNALFVAFFFVPLIGFLTYFSFEEALTSCIIRERSNLGFWQPPIYPFKAIFPFAFGLLFLEGVVGLVKDFVDGAKRSKDA
jgi:TRAP-type mannitol/chloroaromatic compound transport system permease small subunit